MLYIKLNPTVLQKKKKRVANSQALLEPSGTLLTLYLNSTALRLTDKSGSFTLKQSRGSSIQEAIYIAAMIGRLQN